MESQKKSYRRPWYGTYQVIARKLGCHPKYVSQVLRGKLGKYTDRDTALTRKIHELAAEIEAMFEPEENK